jgi:hypothetical protein
MAETLKIPALAAGARLPPKGLPPDAAEGVAQVVLAAASATELMRQAVGASSA